MIIEKQGNILDDDANVIVIPTNCVGVMGKGLALEFKNKWPKSIDPYVTNCKINLLDPGSVHFYQIREGSLYKRCWAAFCTKNHWKDPSKEKWIKEGLATLYDIMWYDGHGNVAIPKIGCGLGGLDWNIVYPMIKERFEDDEIEVRVYV